MQEIADHDTELDEGTVATEKRNHEDVVSTKHSGGQSVTINPTATMRHLQAHVYDTPDFEKKFSTTNSRDGLVVNSSIIYPSRNILLVTTRQERLGSIPGLRL